jgi:hypothetical protein
MFKSFALIKYSQIFELDEQWSVDENSLETENPELVVEADYLLHEKVSKYALKFEKT